MVDEIASNEVSSRHIGPAGAHTPVNRPGAAPFEADNLEQTHQQQQDNQSRAIDNERNQQNLSNQQTAREKSGEHDSTAPDISNNQEQQPNPKPSSAPRPTPAPGEPDGSNGDQQIADGAEKSSDSIGCLFGVDPINKHEKMADPSEQLPDADELFQNNQDSNPNSKDRGLSANPDSKPDSPKKS